MMMLHIAPKEQENKLLSDKTLIEYRFQKFRPLICFGIEKAELLHLTSGMSSKIRQGQ